MSLIKGKPKGCSLEEGRWGIHDARISARQRAEAFELPRPAACRAGGTRSCGGRGRLCAELESGA